MLHVRLQQAQGIIDSLHKQKIFSYATKTLGGLFIIRNHKPACRCGYCPVMQEDGYFK